MAVVLPGDNGTCKSATAEGQLHEVISFLALHQGHTDTNPDAVTNVTANHNQQGKTFSGTYRFNALQSITSDGHLEIEVQPYLVGTGFQVGTGGTFKGNSPEKYCLEILMSPVMAWQLSNVVAREDAKERVYPRKECAENKIDSPVALILAVGRTLVPVKQKVRSVYDLEAEQRAA